MTAPPDLSEGLCVRHPDPEMWDADASMAGDDALKRTAVWANARSAEAKAICRGCPVVAACLEVAMADEGHKSGFYRTGTRGGLDRYERAALAGCEAGHDGRTVPNLAYDQPKGREYPRQGRIAPKLGTRRVS